MKNLIEKYNIINEDMVNNNNIKKYINRMK